MKGYFLSSFQLVYKFCNLPHKKCSVVLHQCCLQDCMWDGYTYNVQDVCRTVNIGRQVHLGFYIYGSTHLFIRYTYLYGYHLHVECSNLATRDDILSVRENFHRMFTIYTHHAKIWLQDASSMKIIFMREDFLQDVYYLHVTC